MSGDLSEVEIVELENDLERNSALRLALAELARTTDDSTGDAVVDGPERLIVGPTLGEGEMATVRHGVQTNLGRPVAVKTLRKESPSGTMRLLQEARLTARLQHPNIVPVHEVIEGRSGELQVVLKQVDGLLWSSVMHRPDVLRARPGWPAVADALDWNLGVLVALCNALAYAHDHGIIHRDLKPSNVMVGRFGEVYLLDWGIAAAWGELGDPDVAHVADAPTAGTRAYMAPEQIEGEPEALGPWTDVYLLGGALYELLSGRPPHADAASRENRRRPRERVVAPLGPEYQARMREGFSGRWIDVYENDGKRSGAYSAPEIAEGVGAVVLELRRNFPDAKILLLAIFPRSVPGDPVRDKLAEVNRIIARLDDQQHVFFMDIGSRFLDEKGFFLPDTFRPDNLHPIAGGYEIWGEAVSPVLAEWLK